MTSSAGSVDENHWRMVTNPDDDEITKCCQLLLLCAHFFWYGRFKLLVLLSMRKYIK